VWGRERSPTDPHVGTDALGVTLELGQHSLGGQSGSRTDLAATAMKGRDFQLSLPRTKSKKTP